MRIGRFGRAIALSLVIHTAGAGVAKELTDKPIRKAISNYVETKKANMLKQMVQEERRKLILREQERIKNGTFLSGGFISSANEWDAFEEGREVSKKTADEYVSYVKNLSSELKTKSSGDAASEVFKDLTYFSINSRKLRMLDAIENKGGSCEPLAHLVGSALYDAGVNEVYLRYYAPNKNGYAHVTATYINSEGKEWDLIAGDYSDGRGSRIHIRDLVKAYSIENGGFVYPPSTDTFEGSVPLFAEHAIGTVGKIKSTEKEKLPEYDCWDFDSDSAPEMKYEETGNFSSLQIIKKETLEHVSKHASSIEGLETLVKQEKDRIYRLLTLANLAFEYEQLTDELVRQNRHNLASEAQKEDI